MSNFFSASIVEFMKEGNIVFVAAPRDRYSDVLIEKGCVFYPINLDRSGMGIIKELTSFFDIYQLIKKLQPHVVLNFTPKLIIYGAIAASFNRVKVINSVAGLGSIFTGKGLKSWVGKVLLRISQPFADHVIFQNNDDMQTYIKHKFISSQHTSRVNGIGIDLNRFTPAIAPDDGVVRFILFSRMLKTKGINQFVSAAEQVSRYYENTLSNCNNIAPKVEFALLGFVDETHPQAISLEQLQCWEQHSSVCYLGESDDISSIVKNYDCVVLPSYYREGIPQCLIEACSMSKPVITTDNVGCRETVIHNTTGYLVEPKSVEALTKAMIDMIELTHAERLLFGHQGRLKAERDFCHIRVSKHYMQIIDEVTFNDGEPLEIVA